jgi:autotransporter-associated beta strand protein
LVLGGGNILCTASHDASPIANPVLMTTDTVITGTNEFGPTYLPFSGTFAAPGGNKLTIANKGWNTTLFGVRLQGPGNIDWPIVVGDPTFDRPAGGVTNQLQLFSDTNTPAQIVSGIISGPGWVIRGDATPNSGGTSIFTAQNTFTGPAQLTGGAIGLGCDSVSSGGVITSGPVGTGLFTIGNQTPAETNMTVFAYGGPRVIENPLFLNGAQNVVVTGTNNLTFTGPINAGGIAKTWTVRDTGIATLSGQITCSGSPYAPLIKAGSGTLVLSADNLYGGTTTVSAGKLLVNNPTGSGTCTNTVIVQSAGTLGGTGTIAGPVSVTGGTIAPGDSAGILTIGGGVNLSSGGTYLWELASNSTNGPGSNFDVLAVTGGNVVLDGTSQIAIGFIGSATAPDAANPFWQTNHSWTILTLSGSAVNPGLTTFSNIVNGSFSAGSFTSHADASGNIILAFAPGSAPLPPRPVISGTIAGVGTANPTLSWSAVSGVQYELQYKTNLNQANWLVVGDVKAAGATASMTHTNSLWPQCYYRVIVPYPQ